VITKESGIFKEASIYSNQTVFLLSCLHNGVHSVGHTGFFMAFNATFKNISDISWLSVLLVEETGVPEENHRPAASH
jgi:hypothetical protein